MCITTPNPIEVLEFCTELMYDEASPRIIDYLAWSDNPGFKDKLCLQLMLSRQHYVNIPTLGFKAHEEKLFTRRFNTISTDNIFFLLIIKQDPDIIAIETAASRDPSYAILMPIKRYLIDHPKQAKEYQGILPFGKEVKKFYNTLKIVQDNEWQIKGSPTFLDYTRLMQITNNMSLLSGTPTVTINTWMYKKGLLINNN